MFDYGQIHWTFNKWLKSSAVLRSSNCCCGEIHPFGWWNQLVAYFSLFRSFANQWIFSHWCLLATMIWSDFQHFRISGSIVCRQLRHTFMDVMKGISPFDRNCEVWPQWMLNMFPTVICPVKEPDIGSACLLPETETCSYGEECCCGKCHTRWGEIMCRMTFSFSMMIIDYDV